MPIRPSSTRPDAGLRLAAALLLAGCASAPLAPAAVPAFAPLPPSSYGGSARVEQTLSAAFGDSEATLQCFLDVSPQNLTVLGLTAGGQRVFTLRYDGVTLAAERAPFAPAAVAPERIVADLQLAFWPLAALRAATAGTPWDISEPRPGLRRVRYGARLVAETHSAGEGAWPARLWLANFASGYSLDIRSSPQAP